MPSLSESVFPRPVRRIDVAPGTHILPVDLRRVPALGVFDWRHNGDGTYSPIIRVKDALMRVSEVERLPLGLSAEVIMKLYRGGFIDGSQPAPNNIIINVMSLLEHIEECAADPDYWTKERRQIFKDGRFDR
jgi:hypothetical protein